MKEHAIRREEQHLRTKVLHVVESFGGGVAGAVITYARLTPELDHHLLLHERADAPLSADTSWKKDFASVTYLPDQHLKALRATRRTIRRLQPEVVHAHSSFGGLYVRLATPRAGGPLIVYTPHGWAFRRMDISSAERMAYRTIERALSSRTDVVAACSEDEARVSPAFGNVHHPGVVVVPNSIAGDAVKEGLQLPAEAPAGSGPLIVGSGRLSPRPVSAKDPQFFIEAIDALREAGIEFRAQWIGGGDPESVRLLREHGISVTGWSSPEQVEAMLARGDLYLHSSLWDGSPLTVLEAYNNRVPTVIRNIDSFRSLPWPFKLNVPQDLARMWHQIMSESGREVLLESAGRILEDNTQLMQRLRLLEAYGVSQREGHEAEELHVPLVAEEGVGPSGTQRVQRQRSDAQRIS